MGALFVGSQNGTVYALDAASGCVRWSFRAGAEVRTSIAVSTWKAGDSKASAGGVLWRPGGPRLCAGCSERQVAVVFEGLDDHPSTTITGAPTYHAGRVYFPVSSLEEAMADPKYPCCTFRGSLVAVQASTGKVVWKTDTIDEKPHEVGKTAAGTPIFAPSGAAIWNSPTGGYEAG
jgi:polyvinyl alcohol dehydrogenase (cytochrome)